MQWENLKIQRPTQSKVYVVSVKISNTYINCIVYYNAINNEWYHHDPLIDKDNLSEKPLKFEGEVTCWIKDLGSCG